MKVPIYESNQVKSSDSVGIGSSVSTSVENYGGGAANKTEVISKAAGVINNIYQEQKRKADEINVTDAQAKLTEFSNRMMSSKDGALSKKGKNSFDLLDTFPEDYKKGLSDIEKNLTNDEQKFMFSKYANQQKLSMEKQLQEHVAQETIRYDNEATKSFIDNKNNEISEMALRDLQGVDNGIAEIQKKLEEHADRNGFDDETKKNLIDKAVSNSYENAISQMISNDKEEVAKEYFKFQKDKIKDANALERIQKMVDDGSNRKMAQVAVDGYMGKGLSESAAYKEAAKIDDAKLREQTENRINLSYSRRDAAIRDGKEKQFEYYLNAAYKTGEPTKVKGWDNLDEITKKKILIAATNRSMGDETITKPDVYKKLKSLAINPETRNDFNKTILLDYVNDLSPADYTQLKSWQTQARKGNQEDLDGVLTETQAIKNSISAAGLTKKEADRYENKINLLVSNHQKALGRKLTSTEISKLSDEFLSESIVINALSNQRPIDLTPEEVKNINYEQIPKTDVTRIETKLKSRGLPVTDQRVRELYQLELNKSLGF